MAQSKETKNLSTITLNQGETKVPNSIYNYDKKVLLISMPWTFFHEPNMALGILKSALKAHGVQCDIIDAPMRLLRHIESKTYEFISRIWAANDFVFTFEFEKEVSPKQITFLRSLLRDHLGHEPSQEDINEVLHLRQKIIPCFLDHLMNEIDFSNYSLIGFSCVFDQTFASLALARRIKKTYPNLMLVFGGTALSNPVGPALQKVFPEMDIVAYGDGEPVIRPLFEASCGHISLSKVPNITYKDDSGAIKYSDRTVAIDLNSSPTPDFDDFFRGIEELRNKYSINILPGRLPVESSRGCWWGRCTFCGNEHRKSKYRSKTGSLVMKQLDELYDRYGVKSFSFTDNIMPMNYFDDFLPKMEKRRAPYIYHYAIKSNLNAPKIELCARAGIRCMQPGIESFSTPVLNKMKKGVTAIQNIFTIYTMMRCGIFCGYNILFKIPGESSSDYEAMLKLIPNLYHLIPPMTCMQVRKLRYSSLVENVKNFETGRPPKVHQRFNVVFSPEYVDNQGLNIENIFYYYQDSQIHSNSKMQMLYSRLKKKVEKWEDRFWNQKAYLNYEIKGENIIIYDTRCNNNERIYKLDHPHKRICELLVSQIYSEEEVLSTLSKENIKKHDITVALNELCNRGILVKEGDSFALLAFHKDAYQPTSIGWGDKNMLNEIAFSKNVHKSSEWANFKPENILKSGLYQSYYKLTKTRCN